MRWVEMWTKALENIIGKINYEILSPYAVTLMESLIYSIISFLIL